MPHVEGEEGTQGCGPFCGQATRTRMEGTTGHLLEAGEDVGCSVRAQGLLGDRVALRAEALSRLAGGTVAAGISAPSPQDHSAQGPNSRSLRSADSTTRSC